MAYVVRCRNRLFEISDDSDSPKIQSSTISGLIGAMRNSSEMGFSFKGGVKTGMPIRDPKLREKEYALSPKHHAEFWMLYHKSIIEPWMCTYHTS